MNYPIKAYNPLTHDIYMCVVQGGSTGKTNTSADSTAQTSTNASTSRSSGLRGRRSTRST